MKIGILTYHRSQNFGALFQAIASCTLLRKKGYDAYIIDYWPLYHKAMYSLFSPWAMIRKKTGAFEYLWESLKNLSTRKKLKRKYDSFIEAFIIPLCAPHDMQFDTIVYGSDQIWRKQPFINDFNPVYFGVHNYLAKRHVSYAASMGKMNLSVEDKQKLKKLLSNLDEISVREKTLYDFVINLGFSNVCQCLDPAFLLKSDQWDKIIGDINEVNERFVLYVNYIKDSFDDYSIREFAKQRNLKYLKVNGSVVGKDSPDAITNIGPKELFDLIRGASYVFTSSFHAMLFSIIYHKEFYAAFASNSERACSILNLLGLSDRLVINDHSPFNDNKIDYLGVDVKLEKLRSNSLNYLYSV